MELQSHSDYQAAVFISAVLPDVSMIDTVREAWHKKPFLLFNGTEGLIVPEAYALHKAEGYKEFGATPELVPHESHFLFMTRGAEILEKIEQALSQWRARSAEESESLQKEIVRPD